MKILHTADWHLGKSIGSISRHPEQIDVLNEICEIANNEKVDAVIIAGDLFDTFNPPVESVDLFYQTLKRLANNGKRLVVAIAGNHDSPDRIEAPDPLAKECGIILAGFPHTKPTPFSLADGISITKSDFGFIEANIPSVKHPIRIVMTSYANEKRLKTYLGKDDSEEALRTILEQHWENLSDKYLDSNGVNILVGHLFMTSKGQNDFVEPEEEKPILDIGGAQAVYLENLPSNLQYVALGHLHRIIKMKNGSTLVHYSGSPLSYSLHEADQSKCVMIVDAVPGENVTVKEVPLTKGKKVTRKTFTSITKAIEWLESNQEILVELSIESDTYLTAEARKQLISAHNGIIDIIPLVHLDEKSDEVQVTSRDLTKSVEDLFVDFFVHETRQKPNKEMMTLLREVLQQEDEK